MSGTGLDKKVEIIATEICGAFTIRLRGDGLVHSHTSSGIDITVESLKKATIVIGKLLNFKKAPLLVTFDEFAIPPVETREFWAQKDACPYASADAYLTPTFGHKLIGNFYLAFNKPGRPTRLFVNQEDAVVWLRTFV